MIKAGIKAGRRSGADLKNTRELHCKAIKASPRCSARASDEFKGGYLKEGLKVGVRRERGRWG
jgi:hypothetical protein